MVKKADSGVKKNWFSSYPGFTTFELHDLGQVMEPMHPVSAVVNRDNDRACIMALLCGLKEMDVRLLPLPLPLGAGRQGGDWCFYNKLGRTT